MNIMICKIWPIKSDNGLDNSLNYIKDENKMMYVNFLSEMEMSKIDKKIFSNNENEEQNLEYEDSILDKTDINLSNALKYVADEFKIKKVFCSGYKCHPDSANEEFNITRMIDQDIKKENYKFYNQKNSEETVAFHLVQSFPKELDISDEEVHQCGLELIDKLEKYQAVVTSHLHPVYDEDKQEVKGECKHNHIIFNAFMLPQYIDKENPNIIKYHNCKETYAQLQIFNDQIALEHGFPIILEPSIGESYSWYESQMINQRKSWKKRVKMDIEETFHSSSNWDEYYQKMIDNGYQIRIGKYITYTTPHNNKVRDNTLGTAYTREHFEEYWKLKKEMEENENFEKDNSERKETEARQIKNELSKLKELLSKVDDLHVKIRMNKSGKYAMKNGLTNNVYETLFSLEKLNMTNKKSFSSYIDAEKIYEITDSRGQPYINILGKTLIENYRQAKEENKIINNENDKFPGKIKDGYYYNMHYRSTVTKRPYRLNTYTRKNIYRRHTSLELLFMLAYHIIKIEHDKWTKKTYPEEVKNTSYIYASRDWKLQSMVDAIQLAANKNIEKPSDIKERLNSLGIDFSRARYDLKNINKTFEKMEYTFNLLREFENMKTILEDLYNNNLNKFDDNQKKRYEEVKVKIENYKLVTSDQKKDFMKRFNDIKNKKEHIEKRFEEIKQEYRDYKKIEYYSEMAANEKFVMGPEYDYKKIYNNDRYKENDNEIQQYMFD